MHNATPYPAETLLAARRCVSDIPTIQNLMWHPDFAELVTTAWQVLRDERDARKAAGVRWC